jgi:septal ring factor EnvC (AmiA/AmiB activator)
MSDEWKKIVPKCFGCVDGIFAMHQVDKNYASKLRSERKKNNISLDELVAECESYLQRKAKNPEHIAEQIKKIRKSFASLA